MEFLNLLNPTCPFCVKFVNIHSEIERRMSTLNILHQLSVVYENDGGGFFGVIIILIIIFSFLLRSSSSSFVLLERRRRRRKKSCFVFYFLFCFCVLRSSSVLLSSFLVARFALVLSSAPRLLLYL